ncbi:MAG TPA: endonuclease III [Gemmatimonadales bacterium]|nr:endonuclease III [Gemmatimonadales bacterium]
MGSLPRTKLPFDIDAVLGRIREAVRPLPKAAMFALAEEGYQTLFEQLIACILSIRTYDEVSLVAAEQLFAIARTPEAVAKLSVEQIDAPIHSCTFHEAKAAQIREIARRVMSEHGGALPCDAEVLQSFRGVGPKCAHLALGIGCGEQRISVDIHVHRVTNRWGYVASPSPEATMRALEARLPAKYWIEINSLLVPFGKHICTGMRPKCSTCPVLIWCEQRGVRPGA